MATGAIRQQATPTPQRLAALFLVYALIATALLSWLMPPFQNADEVTHYLRAAQVADGRLLASRRTTLDANGIAQTSGGGLSDAAILAAAGPYDTLVSNPAARNTSARAATPVFWSRERVFLHFPNTAMYPPTFYLPAALGVAIGRRGHLSVTSSLVLSRMLTGASAAVLGALAIGLADAAAVWLFALLCLPMSLSLMASTSQDGMMLAMSALATSLFVRLALAADGHERLELSGLALALGALAMARPPYTALALLPLALGRVTWRLRLLAALLTAALGIGWSIGVAASSMTSFGGFVGADPGAQIAYLLHQPWQIPLIAYRTWRQWGGALTVGFVGQLGWLSVALPRLYHIAALWMLATAALATVLGTTAGPVRRSLVLAGLLLAAAGLFGIEYVTWTVPRNPWVDGVQGRYFLPLALAAAGLAPTLPARLRAAGVRQGLTALLAAFPIVSIGVTVHAVVVRYYLT